MTKKTATPTITAEEFKAVEDAFRKMGFNPSKGASFNAYGFLDDKEKCREFVGYVQGADAVKRTDAAYMERYAVRAEKFIRAYKGAEIPADLDVKNERVVQPKKEKTEMARGNAKKMQEKDKLDGHPFDKHFTKDGVIYRICVLLHDGKGYSKAELAEKLHKLFPERKLEALATTVSVQVCQLQTRIGKRIKTSKDEKRGTVYNF